jgi:hypothetical protein
MNSAEPGKIWPDGKAFAFTVFDDNDCATFSNNRVVYDFLHRLGLRTTKSVWVRDGDGPPKIAGITCADRDYLAWLKELQQKGFEIAWHHATWETSRRETTLSALDQFREWFGRDPRSMANHDENREGIYWGASRLSGWRRSILGRLLFRVVFSGHEPSSPLFWGDACLERIRYVRNFTFRAIDSLASCPAMPYHDPAKPFVSRWFAASAGADVDEFTDLISPEKVDSLEESGGACIVYTHFGKGFVKGSELDPRFRERIGALAARNAWFPTVSELLDYLEARRGGAHVLGNRERRDLETRWLIDRTLHSIQKGGRR